MPTYNYVCEVCKSTASVTVSITEEPSTPKCLACSVDMSRIFSAPGLSFKGSGWGSDR
jgi:putative FmdB family regulatory protein